MSKSNTEIEDGPKTPARRLSLQSVILGLTLALSMMVAAVLSYELAVTFSDSQAVSTGPKTAQDLQFSFLARPRDLPQIRFVDSTGKPMTLGDFRGRSVLLNIWATWCVPCGKEMPSLDRLQAKFDPAKFLVLTLSIDNHGIPAVQDFYRQLKLKSLGIYVDQAGTVLGLVGAPGVPTTLLVNSKGQEVGRKIGSAEWDKPQTIAVLRQHLELPGDEAGGGGAQ